jgi:hypothetical protein
VRGSGSPAKFRGDGFEILEAHLPLAGPDDPEPWISEREIPSCAIYVLGRAI